MLKYIKFVPIALVTVLAACGGGGGDPGQTDENYAITLRAEKTTLPVNVGNYPVGIGVYAPFTTVLYVNATKGGAPIPSGENVFGCNTEYGLSSGPLYYLDGDEEHQDDEGNPLAFRNIALDANSGGNSFHFHAGIQAFVLDDSNQPTPDASGAKVQVRIMAGTDAANGARLVSGNQSGSILQLPSTGGVALFSLLSGEETGPIFVEFTSDRFDNNVANGI